MARHIKTEILIPVPAQQVWEVLIDFEKYPEWNPFIRNISGEHDVGGQLDVQIVPPEGKAMTFRPTVLVFDQAREFRWKGKLFIPGLFDGEHYFSLNPINAHETKLIHGEYFSGILVGLLGKALKNTKRGFILMNEALSRRCMAI